MQVVPYLYFNSQCKEAFQFYQQRLNGKIEAMLTYADAPPEANMPPDSSGKIMHARLVLDDQVLMGSDAPSGHYHSPQGFSLSLQPKDTQEAERIFNALAENGKVNMPLQQTFWGARFGMLVDQFGIPWMINCEEKQK
jgi:PhnB protein